MPISIQAQEDDVLRKLEAQGYKLDGKIEQISDTVIDRGVVINPFWHNMFIFAEGGGNMFAGDFSTYGEFKDRIAPAWSIGIGKWFTPVFGMNLQFGMGKSKGFMDENDPTPYCYGDIITNAKGNRYWKTKNSWWEASANFMLNLSRAFLGYEGPDTNKRRHQFYLNLGLGYVHHTGRKAEDLAFDDWSGRAELQYSYFFSKKKNLSLDVKAHAIAYQTNFDNYIKGKQIDANFGAAIGLTYYLKNNVWRNNTSTKYVTNYLTHKVEIVSKRVPKYEQLTFYVFYPNNYSGRNDAPQIEGAAVNAIDYLANGIFTQKQYKDNGKVASRLAEGKSARGLDYVDLPTTKAYEAASDDMPRGYEISTKPMSLSTSKNDLANFKNKYEYYYAPIWDGSHEWGYRIDDATKGQVLSRSDNYLETASFGLNSNLGLKYVEENLEKRKNPNIYSFADVYAAIEGNGGYIMNYTDNDKVAKLRQIFNEATITNVSITGVATSQDNNSDENTRMTRNATLAQNRAQTVLSWLKGSKVEKLKAADANIFMVNETSGPIHQVDDKSTQELGAKLHRYVKVCINYIY